MEEIKIVDRFKNDKVIPLVIEKIKETHPEVVFLKPEDKFTEGHTHYVAYRTMSGYIHQSDLDAILPVLMSEKNEDGKVRTVVYDMHDGRLMQIKLRIIDADELKTDGWFMRF